MTVSPFLTPVISASLLESIIETLRTFAALLVVAGMVLAFLRKAAWLMELMAGLACTGIFTYIVWNWSNDIFQTVFVFFFLLIGTFASAAIAEITIVVEGFIITWLGVGVLFITEPGWGFSVNTVFVSAIISAVLIGISAKLGGNITKLFPGMPTRKKEEREPKVEKYIPSRPPTARRELPRPQTFDSLENVRKQIEEMQIRRDIGEIGISEFRAHAGQIEKYLLNRKDELQTRASIGELQKEDVEFEIRQIDELLASLT